MDDKEKLKRNQGSLFNIIEKQTETVASDQRFQLVMFAGCQIETGYDYKTERLIIKTKYPINISIDEDAMQIKIVELSNEPTTTVLNVNPAFYPIIYKALKFKDKE